MTRRSGRIAPGGVLAIPAGVGCPRCSRPARRCRCASWPSAGPQPGPSCDRWTTWTSHARSRAAPLTASQSSPESASTATRSRGRPRGPRRNAGQLRPRRPGRARSLGRRADLPAPRAPRWQGTSHPRGAARDLLVTEQLYALHEHDWGEDCGPLALRVEPPLRKAPHASLRMPDGDHSSSNSSPHSSMNRPVSSRAIALGSPSRRSEVTPRSRSE